MNNDTTKQLDNHTQPKTNMKKKPNNRAIRHKEFKFKKYKIGRRTYIVKVFNNNTDMYMKQTIFIIPDYVPQSMVFNHLVNCVRDHLNMWGDYYLGKDDNNTNGEMNVA